MNLRNPRLLPSVVLIGGMLLFLKGSGLVHDAYAQSAIADKPQSTPAAPATTEAATGEPMRADAAPPPAPAAAPAPVSDDSDDEDVVTSASEHDLLTSLARRRSELDQRSASLDMQAQMLAATETRVDSKIAQLKQMQAQITALLGQRDQAQQKQLDDLVKTYSAMKPKDAARIFENLSDDVLVPVAQAMKSDTLAPVLAAMSPEAAQKLTLKLADKLTLPDTNAAPASPAPAQAAAPIADLKAADPKPVSGG